MDSSDSAGNINNGEDLFLFGYGSLLWKQNFTFSAKFPCYIKGYKRVFYQGSTDHRGVPGKPGRVVTLLPDPEGWVDGVVFQIPASEKQAAIVALDIREKGGYDRLDVTSYCHQRSPQHSKNPTVSTTTKHEEKEVKEEDLHQVLHPKTLVYIANEQNEEYLGPASDEAIAAQIVSSEGPSGPNYEYLYNLGHSLQQYGFQDPHVEGILAVAQKLHKSSTPKTDNDLSVGST